MHSFLLFCNFKTRKKKKPYILSLPITATFFTGKRRRETAIKSKKNCFPPYSFFISKGKCSERQKCSTVICLSGSVALGWLCDPAIDGGSSHSFGGEAEDVLCLCLFWASLEHSFSYQLSCGSSVKQHLTDRF